ncbi:MAG: UDP-glucose 4-epimerase GalE [Bryobacteraceae bacterium]
MNILVTGGAGYIGSHTAKALAQAGHVPVVYDNLEKGHRWAVQWGPLVEGDMADREKLLQTMKEHSIEGAIHFAAYIAVGESMSQPERYFRNNVCNSLNLLGAMEQAGVRRIVFSSTAAVYGMPESTPIPEDHRKAPVNAYGEGKWMVEKLIEWFGQIHGFHSARLRYFNAAGADPDCEIGEDHEPETHLIPLALAAAAGRIANLQLFGTDYPTKDGTAVRDYIHVTDLADAHVRALDHIGRTESSVILNLGTGEGHTVREVIETASRVTGREVPVLERPRREGDPAALVADSRAARELLNWEPSHSGLEEILETAWRWYRRNEG